MALTDGRLTVVAGRLSNRSTDRAAVAGRTVEHHCRGRLVVGERLLVVEMSRRRRAQWRFVAQSVDGLARRGRRPRCLARIHVRLLPLAVLGVLFQVLENDGAHAGVDLLQLFLFALKRPARK